MGRRWNERNRTDILGTHTAGIKEEDKKYLETGKKSRRRNRFFWEENERGDEKRIYWRQKKE